MIIQRVLIILFLTIHFSIAEEGNIERKNIVYSQIEIISVDWFSRYQYKIKPSYIENLHKKKPIGAQYNYLLIRQPVKIMLLADSIHNLECMISDDAEWEVDGRLVIHIYDGNSIFETYFANRTKIANLTTNEVCKVDDLFWEQFGFIFDKITEIQVAQYKKLWRENSRQP